MKKHIKLFEEFGYDEPKEYFAVVHYTDGRVYDIFDNEADARSAYREYSEEEAEKRGGEQEDVEIREIDLYDDDQLRDLFRAAVNWGDRDIVRELISIGADPMLYFESKRRLDAFLNG